MSARQELAWKLAKRRAWMMRSGWPERLRNRDVIGTALADLVSLARLLYVALTDGSTQTTEVERRAVVCARRRLQAKVRKER